MAWINDADGVVQWVPDTNGTSPAELGFVRVNPDGHPVQEGSLGIHQQSYLWKGPDGYYITPYDGTGLSVTPRKVPAVRDADIPGILSGAATVSQQADAANKAGFSRDVALAAALAGGVTAANMGAFGSTSLAGAGTPGAAGLDAAGGALTEAAAPVISGGGAPGGASSGFGFTPAPAGYDAAAGFIPSEYGSAAGIAAGQTGWVPETGFGFTPAPAGGLDYAAGVANGTIDLGATIPFTLQDTIATATGMPALASTAAKTAGAGALSSLTPEQVAKASQTPGLLDKIISGTATATDLAKLGLGAAAIGALASEDPDRTSTTKVEYPDWYNDASKKAIALADQYAALGPDAVAPLSANENAAIEMAKDSAGNWVPLLDKSTGALDESRQYYDKAGVAADSVSGYLDRSGVLADEAAGGIPSLDLSAYMNPYLDSVLEPIRRRNEIEAAAALNDIKAKAGMRGAFGGSRSTLLESQTSEAADRNMNEAEANIRSGAFSTGLTAAQADLNRKLTASGQFSTLGNAANNNATAFTNIGRSLTDAASGYRNNAGALSDLTGADITRLTSTGGTQRGVAQAKLDAPLKAINGYASALRGNPGSTTTSVAPEASKIGQATGALTALVGANKAGWFS